MLAFPVRSFALSAARILVVEDNPADVFLLRHALTGKGETFEMEVVQDGGQALQYVRSQWKRGPDSKPCVILLDLHLPKEDGIEVLRAIRQESDLAHVSVVVVTSMATPREEAELQALGADYRLKPKTLSEYSDLAADLIAICQGKVTA
jgi:CheY-like chemotaxis protein